MINGILPPRAAEALDHFDPLGHPLCEGELLVGPEDDGILRPYRHRFRMGDMGGHLTREGMCRLCLEPHGTIALVARAFHEGQLSESEALRCVTAVHRQSSPYVTSDLVERGRMAISSHRR